LGSCGFFLRDNKAPLLAQHNKTLNKKLGSDTTAVVLQSTSETRYRESLERLISEGKAFACACTRKQLADFAVYPGTCRERSLPFAGNSIRLRVPPGQYRFSDGVFGQVSQDVAEAAGDFVIKRRDGLWSYQLASVVDDAEDQVSEIVRGADLLDNTPRQLVLLECLQKPAPAYVHIPIVVDSNGEKLSKQTLAEAVDADNPLPSLLAAWQFLGQVTPSKCETVAQFWQHAELSWDLDRVPNEPTIVQSSHDNR